MVYVSLIYLSYCDWNSFKNKWNYLQLLPAFILYRTQWAWCRNLHLSLLLVHTNVPSGIHQTLSLCNAICSASTCGQVSPKSKKIFTLQSCESRCWKFSSVSSGIRENENILLRLSTLSSQSDTVKWQKKKRKMVWFRVRCWKRAKWSMTKMGESQGKASITGDFTLSGEMEDPPLD